jgi:hypothetical protein
VTCEADSDGRPFLVAAVGGYKDASPGHDHGQSNARPQGDDTLSYLHPVRRAEDEEWATGLSHLSC